MILARLVVWAARQAEMRAETAAKRQGAETWLNELIWRGFYAAILYDFSDVRRAAFRAELRSIP
jgi:deoxyribodipyrimidine photolyase